MKQGELTCISKDELWSFIVAEPLLSYFFLRSNIEEIPDYDAVAAISVVDGKITLRLNSTRMPLLSSRQKIGTLVHEYLHVLLQHCTGRMRHKTGAKAKKENYAMDMAINQIIRKTWDLPEFAVFHDRPQFGFPPELSAEEYFNLLEKKYPDFDFENEFGKDDNLDSHGGWTESKPEDDALIKEMTRSYTNNHGHSNLGDTLSHHPKYSGILEDILAKKVSNIRWDVVVRQFAHSVKSNSIKRTYKRPSRRFGFPIQGVAQKYTTKLAAIVDTSASMTPKFLSHIGGQLNAMTASMQIDVMMCDSEVHKDRMVKRFRPSQSIEFHGRRGTDLQPAFSLAEKDNYKGVVCFTDGFFGTQISCKLPILWVCLDNKRFSPNVGKVIHIDSKEV